MFRPSALIQALQRVSLYRARKQRGRLKRNLRGLAVGAPDYKRGLRRTRQGRHRRGRH